MSFLPNLSLEEQEFRLPRGLKASFCLEGGWVCLSCRPPIVAVREGQPSHRTRPTAGTRSQALPYRIVICHSSGLTVSLRLAGWVGALHGGTGWRCGYEHRQRMQEGCQIILGGLARLGYGHRAPLSLVSRLAKEGTEWNRLTCSWHSSSWVLR